MSNKKDAIISTLLDRQSATLDSVLREYPLEIITPKLFLDNHLIIAKKNQVGCVAIEDEISEDELKHLVAESKNINKLLDEGIEKLRDYLKKNDYPKSLAEPIINSAKNRTEKICKLYHGLDKLKGKYNIKALLVNQEYMIHEASLIQWAKQNNIPSIHLCHSPYIARNLSSIRHFLSDHLTLTSSRCNETLDDMNTGKGERHQTGLVNWDAYRDLDFNDISKLKEKLKIPDDALTISFFTTYAVKESATSDPLTYEKTLDNFIETAARIKKESNKPVFFIVKDRPSGTSFGEERANHLAKKLGIADSFAYIFDRPENVILISDITISPGSSIAVESMAMGCATVELVTRQVFLGGLVFSATDGVAQCNEKGLYKTLSELVEDDDKRSQLVEVSSNNTAFVDPTINLNATQLATAKILEIIDKPSLANKVLENDNFYDELDTQSQDARFIVKDSFQTWLAKTQPDELTGQLMGERYNTWSTHPTFHLLLVVDPSSFTALADTLDSFELQIYKHYGISVLSTAKCPIEGLEEQCNIQWIQTDSPFKKINEVIETVDSDWVMQLWPGDELHPQALFNIADYANLNPDWLAIYGDEVLVKLSEQELTNEESRLGTSHPEDPAFKPDFNLDLLRSTDYVNRAVAFRKDAWKALDGYQPFAYRQNEDLVFRLAERMTLPAIGHVPYILVNRSPYTKQLIESENYEGLGATIRLQHLVRCGYEHAKVLPGLYQGVYNTQYNLDASTEKTDLLIATPTLDSSLHKCLSSYIKSDALEKSQLYLAAPVNESEFAAWLIDQQLVFEPKGNYPVFVSLNKWQGELAAWSQLVDVSVSETLVFAVSRLRFIQAGWLNALLDQLQRPDVAMTAPRLVSANASILSAGQILGKNGLVGDLYENFFLEQEVTGLPRAWCEQNFNVLNPACLAVKRSKLLEQGGLNQEYTSLLAVNDLQLKCCLAGNKLVWTPLSSVALIGDKNYQISQTDNQLFKKSWFNLLTNDPAFNPNLSLRDSGLDADDLLAGKWHHYNHQRPRILILTSDITPKQTLLGKSLFKALDSSELKEKVQTQSYQYLSASETTVVNAIEVARLNPDVCIYLGKTCPVTNTIEDLFFNTNIEQWALVDSEINFQDWKKIEAHLTGFLVADPELFVSLSQKTNKRLIIDTKFSQAEEISKKHLSFWLEEIFGSFVQKS